MSGYLLITDLKHPGDVQAALRASLADVASAFIVPPDSVRLEPQRGTDLFDKAKSDRLIHSIMQAVKGLGEKEAQMGFFTDLPPA